MKKKDPNYIVKVEKEIAKKYGDKTIQHPKSQWTDEKEKEYVKQLKDLYKMFNFKSVIVDGSNSKWNRNRVEAEAGNLHIPICNTDKGAFAVKI